MRGLGSTNRAFRCLTSEFKWDRVFSTKYGRDAVQPFSTAADSTRRFSRAVPHRGPTRAFRGPNRPNQVAVRRTLLARWARVTREIARSSRIETGTPETQKSFTL